jgi:Leucine-rich repeat (LRR) protein
MPDVELPVLEQLNLSHNLLESTEDFSFHFVSLTNLDISANKLANVEMLYFLDHIDSIVEINFAKNAICTQE